MINSILRAVFWVSSGLRNGQVHTSRTTIANAPARRLPQPMTTHAQAVEIAAEKRRALLQRALDDPDFAKKRTRAAALVRAEMDRRLIAAGFQADGRNVWRLKGWWYDLAVELQRSQLGQDAWINLTAMPRVRARAVQRRLGDFYPGPPHVEEPGRMTCQALIEDPALLDAPMQVFDALGLPWLIGMGRFIPTGR